MANQVFKINDIVIYNGVSRDGFTNGDKCVIVADKDVPYKMFSKPNEDQYPSSNKDFIINLQPISKDAESELHPLIEVLKTDITLYEKV